MSAPPSVPEIVDHFRACWASPAVHDYRFLSLFSPDVRLRAPLAGRSRGVEAGDDAFRRTFAVLPDLTAEIDDWAFDGDRLFIAMRFRTSAGRYPLEWPSVDVLDFEAGLVVARRAYFDPLPLMRYFLVHPRLLGRWLWTRWS